MRRLLVGLIGFMLCCYGAVASAQISWQQWVSEVRQDAVTQGISPHLFDEIFSQISAPSKQVKHFERTQPEKRLTFNEYRKTRADNYRIQLGRKEFSKYQSLLLQIGNEYQVDPCVIVSIWGMETSYGRFMGDFPVVKSLATLAYDSSRKDFFYKQLMLALHIVNDGHVSLERFKGEWAGASGHPQFLPSSWYDYAVDYTGDGRKNIWTELPDALASIANYLHQNGWQYDEPWAIEVKLPKNFNKDQADLKITKSVQAWDDLGIRTKEGKALPYSDLEASIVTPYGGPAFLAFNNFKVIMTYNKSTYYAGSIGYMADKICRRA